jgi:hypothetical protein
MKNPVREANLGRGEVMGLTKGALGRQRPNGPYLSWLPVTTSGFYQFTRNSFKVGELSGRADSCYRPKKAPNTPYGLSLPPAGAVFLDTRDRELGDSGFRAEASK